MDGSRSAVPSVILPKMRYLPSVAEDRYAEPEPEVMPAVACQPVPWRDHRMLSSHAMMALFQAEPPAGREDVSAADPARAGEVAAFVLD